MTLGERIYQLRRKKKWSQTKLSQVLKIHMRNINRYEKNLSVPSALILKKMSEVFEVSSDYLLFGDAENLAAAKVGDKTLLKYFEEVDKLNEEDKEFVIKFLKMVKTKNKFKELTEEI